MQKYIQTAIIVALALCALPLEAQPATSLRPHLVANLPPCSAALNGTTFAVKDATSSSDLGAGGGTASAIAMCDSTSYVASAAAVSGIDGNPSVVIDTDEAGSDVTVTPADDLILTGGDAVTVSAAGLILIDSTAGASVTIDTDAAASDIIVTPADDLLLTPVDALTVSAGGAASITTTAGAVGLTAGGTTQDITLTSVDDVIFVPTDALTATVGGAVAITTTAGAVGLTAGGTTEDITLTSVDDVILAATDDTTIAGDAFGVNTTSAIIDAGAGADELTVTAGVSTFTGSLIIPISATVPVACAAGSKGTIYYDSDLNELCVCNATDYKQIDDMSTTCS
jgi:hypothetical protein